jgi:hypothetical protein
MMDTLEAAPLAEAGEHAVQHLGPVAGLGPAGARVQAQVGVVGVHGPGQQGLDLEGMEVLLQLLDLAAPPPPPPASCAVESVSASPSSIEDAQLLHLLDQVVERD